MTIIIFYLISLILIFLNFFISKNKINDREKSSSFECGFDPISSPRLPFSIQFYLISIIFLIFDIEIILFLPIFTSINSINIEIWALIIIFFIIILLIGIYNEWNDGALIWLK